MKDFKINALIIALTLALFMSCGKKGTEPEPEPEPEPKIISGPNATSILTTSATVIWVTDQNTDSQVKYGQTSGSYDSTLSSDELTTEHSIVLSNLQVYTPYFYIVISNNENGTATSAESTFTTQVNAPYLLNRAWYRFEQGQYLEAVSDFKAALNMNSNLNDAYVGLGWSYSFLDSLDEAKKQFDIALSKNSQLLDAYVGRGMIFLSKNKYYLSVLDLNYVLEKNSAYVFTHNTNIDYKDIHIALAEAYFYQGKYSKAQEHVDIIWPGNGLDADESTTWVVDSVTYATYQEALLSAIEKLQTMIIQ